MKLVQTLVMELVEEVEEVEEVKYPTTHIQIFPVFEKSYYKWLSYRDMEKAEEYEAECCTPYPLKIIPPLFYGFSAITN